MILSRFVRNDSASSLIEFALSLPILLLMFLGATEVTRYILVMQKVDNAAYTIADIITRTEAAISEPAQPGSLTVATLDDAINTLDDLIAPYDTLGRTTVIVTSFQKPDATSDPIIRWQKAQGVLGASIVSSISGTAPINTQPALRNAPVGFSPTVAQSIAQYGGMKNRENVIAVEVFYRYNTITGGAFFGDFLEGSIIKRSAFFNPRFGSLVNLPPIFTGA